MAIDITNERRFEEDIEASFLTNGGLTKLNDVYDPKLGLYVKTLTDFVKASQPKEWNRFLLQNKVDPEKKFCLALMKNDVVDFIASDTHNTDDRKPNLEKCASYVARKMGKQYAKRIFCDNPLNILKNR